MAKCVFSFSVKKNVFLYHLPADVLWYLLLRDWVLYKPHKKMYRTISCAHQKPLCSRKKSWPKQTVPMSVPFSSRHQQPWAPLQRCLSPDRIWPLIRSYQKTTNCCWWVSWHRSSPLLSTHCTHRGMNLIQWETCLKESCMSNATGRRDFPVLLNFCQRT